VTLYVNSDTQEVCTEAEMREAFTSAENDDIRGLKLRVGDGTAIWRTSLSSGETIVV
jgi:hypothetical protein